MIGAFSVFAEFFQRVAIDWSKTSGFEAISVARSVEIFFKKVLNLG